MVYCWCWDTVISPTWGEGSNLRYFFALDERCVKDAFRLIRSIVGEEFRNSLVLICASVESGFGGVNKTARWRVSMVGECGKV